MLNGNFFSVQILFCMLQVKRAHSSLLCHASSLPLSACHDLLLSFSLTIFHFTKSISSIAQCSWCLILKPDVHAVGTSFAQCVPLSWHYGFICTVMRARFSALFQRALLFYNARHILLLCVCVSFSHSPAFSLAAHQSSHANYHHALISIEFNCKFLLHILLFFIICLFNIGRIGNLFFAQALWILCSKN